ncbi:MAG: type II secretion system protein [Candidatus Gastranaerophilaceae bacterium]|nr:type II secretion system protein [Candidatus Gastranaerophilaceae bacterium]
MRFHLGGGAKSSCSKAVQGFTLAEVLITLGIIGVVAAITLPALIDSVTERKNSERHANIVYKVTQAMEMMKVHGELGRRYDTTEAFVDELQKYLKVSKRCDSNHIADCWPTDKVTDGEGNEFEVSKAKKGKNLSLNTDTNNVGLILGDGASIILNYNPESGIVDETDAIVAVKKSLPVGGGRSKEFVYTSNATASIDFVTDVNGSAHPNAETSNNVYHDIRNLTAARFTKGCAGIELSGVGCVVNVGQQLKYYDAEAKCTSMGMTLPDTGTLENIYNQKANNSNLPQTGWFWSYSSSPSVWIFSFDSGTTCNNDKSSGYKRGVICVGN